MRTNARLNEKRGRLVDWLNEATEAKGAAFATVTAVAKADQDRSAWETAFEAEGQRAEIVRKEWHDTRDWEPPSE